MCSALLPSITCGSETRFYEDDLRTSIAKIEFTDLTGVLQGVENVAGEDGDDYRLQFTFKHKFGKSL